MLQGRVYQMLIDPLLSRIHTMASELIPEESSVLDVACGNGTLSIKYAKRASHVMGIDISGEMIRFASERVHKANLENVILQEMNATDLSGLGKVNYDIASVSMAIHQFDLETGISLLKALKEVSGRVMILDYRFPLPGGFSGISTRLIEKIAGEEHYRNFKSYMGFGGLQAICREAGLEPVGTPIHHGVFTIMICK